MFIFNPNRQPESPNSNDVVRGGMRPSSRIYLHFNIFSQSSCNKGGQIFILILVTPTHWSKDKRIARQRECGELITRLQRAIRR